MKYIVILVLLASCSNNKKAITNQIRDYQDSLNMVTKQQLNIEADAALRQKAYMDKKLPMDYDLKDVAKIHAINQYNIELGREYSKQEAEISLKQLPLMYDLQAKEWHYESRIKELKFKLDAE
jgi:hypothetical protein